MNDSTIIIKVACFLWWANFLPPFAHLIWEKRYSHPLDNNMTWFDDRHLFGPHKTWRGFIFCLIGSLVFTPVLQLPWLVVLYSAAFVLCGDLITSFIKRRLNKTSGEMFPVVDQLLESLLPTLFLFYVIPLSRFQVVGVLTLFIPFSFGASLIWNRLIFHSSAANSPRIIRTTTRVQAWRACHQPLARYHTLLNFENFIYYRIIISLLFKGLGLYKRGICNALDIRLKPISLSFSDLPKQFEGFRILLITDLHLDGLELLADRAIALVKDLDVDLCLIGGDIRMEVYGPAAPCLRKLRFLMPQIKSKHGIFGILGNHDCIEMVPDLEEAGVVMLVNDSWRIDKDGASIWIAGIDDPHFYKVHDLEDAFHNVPGDGFTIFLSHSPEAYAEAAAYKPDLYLCGHTHGGQIRLPKRGPIFTHSRAPRYTADGLWRYKGMTGLTSRGLGASGVPIRFNCPGEINLIHLHKKFNPEI